MRPTLNELYIRQSMNSSSGEYWAGPPEMIDVLARVAATRSQDRVLDVGAGIGGSARHLASLVGCRVDAVDLVVPLLQLARARDHEGVHYLGARAEALPFAAHSFDQLWCLGVVAHVEDRELFAREAARVLRPGGLTVLTEALWEGDLEPRFQRTAPDPWFAIRPHRLVNELKEAGFVRVDLHDWPGHEFQSLEVIEEPHLRADVLEARLVPRLILATNAWGG